MGPTACGKTDLAIALCNYLPVELISADSALIYQGMDIGTAKPEPEILKAVPHRMVDICDPAEPFSVADYAKATFRHMQEITQTGRIPLLVGGTMLYFRTLLDGLAKIPPTKPGVREAIEERAAEEGWPALHAELAQVDPRTAATIHPNHSRRIQRALEVYQTTGKPISAFRDHHQSEGATVIPPVEDRYRVIQIGLLPEDRQVLHQRIDARFLAMLHAGFEDEVRALMARGDLDESMPSVRAVGYQQMWLYLSGRISRDEMIAQAQAATRQLAKRQLTWLRKWDELCAVAVDKDHGKQKEMQQLVEEALQILSAAHIY
ncbi:MAG: tRNA (adenosine(37)-N6)-dimethylallyltransferase MiaA [bacterium]